MKLHSIALMAIMVTLCMSQDSSSSEELDTFVRQVEFSMTDLDEQEAIDAVMDSYKDLALEYEADTDRLEQDLIGTIQDTYGDSTDTVTSFVEFVRELRRQSVV